MTTREDDDKLEITLDVKGFAPEELKVRWRAETKTKQFPLSEKEG